MTQSFTAEGSYSDGSTQDLTLSVTWDTSSTSVATISNAPGNEGLATSVGEGTTTITALDLPSGISGSTTLTVTAAVMTSLEVTPTNPSIALGTTQSFTATGTFSDGSTQDLTTSVTWSSSSPAIATISNAPGTEGLATSVSEGATTITALDVASSISGSTTLAITAAVLTSIEVAPTNPSIALGTTQSFTATGTYSDGSTQDLTTSVTWSSSSPAIATISNASGSEGLATGVSEGTATITALDVASSISGSTTLTVTAAVLTSIEVAPTNPSIALGTTQSFTATGTYSDGSTQDLTTSVTWSSSIPAIASISNASGTQGLATSVSEGATTITALDVPSAITGSTTLTITAAVLTSIEVTPTNPSIALGTTQSFTATGTYSDGSTQDLTTSVTWSSSSPAMATISNAPGTEGLATSVSEGATTVTALDVASSISGSTTLTITAAVLTSIEVAPTNPSIALGTTQSFTATGTYSDGSTQDLTTSVTWSSSSPAFATISNAPGTEGLATSVSEGATTVTALDVASSISGSTMLTVTAAVLTSIEVTPTNPSIALGTTQSFTATGTYSDGSIQELTTSVTWTSGSPAVATISNASGSEGLATSVSEGATTITALEVASGITGSTSLTITPAVLTSIDVTPTDPSIALGATQPFTATGTFSDGTTQDLTTSVTWSSGSPAIATISNTPGTEGLATSIGEGATTITADDPHSAIAGSTTLTVDPALLVSIAVTPAAPSVALGASKAFHATGTYSDGSTRDLTATLVWSTASPAIATISNALGSSGSATGMGQGTTTITALDPSSSLSDTSTLTVTAAVLTSIEVTPSSPSITVGGKKSFTATGTLSDGSRQDLTKSVTWSSSRPTVATISNTPGSFGVATSVQPGISRISAEHPASGLGGRTSLSVTAPVGFCDRKGSYYANDGENGVSDRDFGEFGPDLGGFIPFARFDELHQLVGHRLARMWDASLAGKSFREMALENFTDLRGFDAQLRAFGGTSLLPIPGRAIELESAPVQRTTWWGLAITMFPYRVNGGPALVCVPDTTLAAPPEPLHLLLVNLPAHDSDFGVNRNHVATAWLAPSGGWAGPPGAPLLSPDEQALARGDVVVISQENYSASVWIALQRTQEAEYFVREQLLPSLGIVADPATSRSFLFGGSWGGVVSAYLALMQPKVYAGSGGYSIDDWTYGIGDQRMILSFHAAATGMLVPDVPNDPFYAPFYAIVDLLGTRFDDPQTLASGATMQPWDLAAFCVNRRESELQVPIHGVMAGEDWIFNCHWSSGNAAFNAPFQPQLRRNLEHGAVHGVLPGYNEYSIWSGDEWDALIAGASPTAANVPLVPDSPPPPGIPVYPDPYSSTLRHAHVADSRESFLTEIDLSAASHAPGSGVRSLGQGVFPAWDDSLFVGNVDGDPRTEVVFGNLDGHVHVLEFDKSRDPGDPFRLYDEWKSPYLGRELFAIAVSGEGAAAQIFAADGLGQVWRIVPSGGGFAASAAPIASPATAPKFLYPGPTRFLSVGDFASASPGLELLAYNRFCDWSMLSAASGAPIAGGRMQRGLHATGAASAAVADLTGDGDDELLIASHDGFVWAIDPPPSGDFSLQATPGPVALSEFLDLAISRIVPIDLDQSPGTSHLLLIGRNDARDDGGMHGTNLIQLFDVARRTVVGEVEANKFDPLNTAPFTWIKSPSGKKRASFVLCGPGVLQKFTLDFATAPSGTSVVFALDSEVEVVDLEDAAVRGTQICAIESFKSGGAVAIVVALGNGRLAVFDEELEWARDSSKEYGSDPDVTGSSKMQPWYSNRSLARTFACDLVQEVPGGDASLYFAEFSQPLLRGPLRYRVGKLDLPAIGAASWDAFVMPAPNGAGYPGRVDFNRRLRFIDADGDGTREPRVYAEVGDCFVDAASGAVREFCNVAWRASFFPGNDPSQLFGGHVFEVNDLASNDYSYLGGFFVPRDPTQPCADFGGDDWWYPVVGPNRLTGQVANHSQSVFEPTLNASMKAVDLPDPGDASRIAQNVAIGTQGGYVFAIEPGAPDPLANGATPSTLSYASIDLGVSVLGLDAGNLDDDPEMELVAGTFLDTGSYADWVDGDASRNRGQVIVLDPQPASGGGPGSFAMTTLDGDDRFGPGGGIGAGVAGVKIDDVDGDGVNEIWCGDAVGHLWLFRRTAGSWHCVFRSADLAAYPGLYNNLHPIKDVDGRTVKLVVVSAGYVMAFAVDWQMLMAW